MFRLNLKDSSYYYITKNFLQNTKKIGQNMSEKCILYTFICFDQEIW